MSTEMTIAEFCDYHDACGEGREWALANCESMQNAWETAKPEWLLWIGTRPGVLPDRDLRLFAVRCARSVQHLMPDARSVAALDVAERHANGAATDDELAAARAAARDAARDAAWAAAWDAARDAAWAAARDAAWAAAWAAAWDAAWAAFAADMRKLTPSFRKVVAPVAKVPGQVVRTVTRFEVLDAAVVYAARPDLCRLEVAASAVNRAIAAGERNIPGLRIWEETVSGVRV